MSLVSLEIIGQAGTAKTSFIEAIRFASKGMIQEAEQAYAEGDEAFVEAHKTHAAILTKFANGENIDVDVLLVHAECQLMSTEDFKVIAEELISYMTNK